MNVCDLNEMIPVPRQLVTLALQNNQNLTAVLVCMLLNSAEVSNCRKRIIEVSCKWIYAVYNLRIHLNLSIQTSDPKFNLPG